MEHSAQQASNLHTLNQPFCSEAHQHRATKVATQSQQMTPSNGFLWVLSEMSVGLLIAILVHASVNSRIHSI